MCRVCAKTVQDVLKSRLVEHILYTLHCIQNFGQANKWSFSTTITHRFAYAFSTAFLPSSHLLNEALSTQYTGTITSTTKRVNE